MMASSTLTLFSPAKVNLFLHITGKREDGYHNLQTVFRLLDWGDTLTFSMSDKRFNPHLPLTASNLPISLQSSVSVTDDLLDNLVTKSAIALLSAIKSRARKSDALMSGALKSDALLAHQNVPEHTITELPKSLPVIDIQLEKILPTGAGLGGGSSNAATTLLALNNLWNFELDNPSLIEIGSKVGADVPIFILGQDAIGEGIGEILSPIKLPNQHYLILNPNAHASTQTLFNHPQLKRNTPKLNHSEIVEQKDKFFNDLSSPFCNVFQQVVIDMVPEVAEAMDYLRTIQNITATTPRMTGTGSSLFIPIPEQYLTQIKKHINQQPPPCSAVLTKTL